MHLRGNMNLPQYIHLDHESQYSEPKAINILTIRARKLPKSIRHTLFALNKIMMTFLLIRAKV